MSIESIGSNIPPAAIFEEKPEVLDKMTEALKMAAPSDPRDVSDRLHAQAKIQANLRELIAHDTTSKVMGKALAKAAENGDLDTLEAMISDPLFNDIPVKYLGRALESAAEKSQLDSFQILLDCPRFKEIPPEMLTEAFREAVSSCGLHITRLMVSCSRFHEVTLGGFTRALYESAVCGHVSIFLELIESPKFKEIDPQSLGEILITAVAEYGQVPILRALIQNPRFAEISNDDLCKAFIKAAERDRYIILQDLAHCSRSSDLTPGTWILARHAAVTHGHEKAETVLHFLPSSPHRI